MLKKYANLLILCLILLAIFQLYVSTTYPAFKNNDSPETITSACLLGIGHPPAYPLYTMAAKIFTLLPLGSPAFRVNLFACFLAVLVLCLTYMIIRKHIQKTILPEGGPLTRALGYGLLFLLAFSYIFWNQAIEAKGGIYMLNLLFLSLLVYLSLGQLQVPSLESREKKAELDTRDPVLGTKNIYLISYVFGLSLANHWPSMLMLLPIFLFIVWKERAGMNRARLRAGFFLAAAGASAYLYLPIRAAAGDVYFFLARPDTWDKLWWTISRAAYKPAAAAGAGVYLYQLREALLQLAGNHMFLGLLALPGFYALFKNNRRSFGLLVSVIALTFIAVVFINRTPAEALWVIAVFLMPAQYAVFIFISAGAYFVFDIAPGRVLKACAAVLIAGLIAFCGYSSFHANDSRANYISYDFGNNALITAAPGSMLLADGDYYVMPLSYLMEIEKKGSGIKYQQLATLSYKWGWEEFNGKYGIMEAAAPGRQVNILDILNYYPGRGGLYLTNYAPALEGKLRGLEQSARGILFRVTPENPVGTADIFAQYSMRGLFRYRSQADEWMAPIYGQRMEESAVRLSQRMKFKEALPLYRAVYYMPGPQDRAGACYNMGIVYKFFNDVDNEFFWLNETIKIDKKFWRAHQEKGILYFKMANLRPAKQSFEEALKYGSENKVMVEEYLNEINRRLGE